MSMAVVARGNSHRIRFEPALEGLRGFALFGMLCFHSEFSWAVGGFLPIATFFSLSGYLITSLFLREWEKGNAIRLVPFWARRFRRLMPAALLTLAAMPLFASFVATPAQNVKLADDVLWSLLYVANWHFYLSDSAYTQLFAAPSPVQHFWSLAIEEQFYFAYPLIVLFGLRLGGRSGLGFVLLLLTLASVAWSVWLSLAGASVDRIYYGSDTRAAELLMGGGLAVVLFGREIASQSVRAWLQRLGVVAMVAMVGTWATVHLEERWLYLGGFAAYSFLSLAVITAGVQEGGFVRWLLSRPLMRWTGRVSYGAYLFHWPVFLWLSADRVGVGEPLLFILRTAVTFGLAGLSYRYFESPIRTGQWLTGWRPWVVTPTAFAGIVVLVTVVTTEPRQSYARYDPTGDVAAATEMITALGAATPPRGSPPSLGQKVPRVSVFGDSTAAALNVGLQFWLGRNGTGLPRMGLSELGCGLERSGAYRFQGKVQNRAEHCSDRDSAWREALLRDQSDVAVVLFGPWEVCDRRLEGDTQWRRLGDPVLDERMRREMLEAVDLLSSQGALVMWVTHPKIEVRDPTTGVAPKKAYPESDPRRMERYNELVRELPDLRPGKVVVIDLVSYLRSLEGGELAPRYRPDGTHLSAEGTLKLAHDWFEPEVLRVYLAASSASAED